METMKQSGSWSSLGTHASLVVMWWLCISSSGETWKFDLEGHGQMPHKTIGILTKLFCTAGQNLVTLAWMGDDSWCGQAQNRVNLDFQVKFDLEGQGRSLHKQ